MILRNSRGRKAALVLAFVAAAACDSGEPSRTADEFAADSALAADLALANRDTLLVDSIGAYREPAAAEDTAADTARAPVSPAGPAKTTAVTPPAPEPVEPTPSRTATQPEPARAPATARRLSGLRACNSPTQENQSECLRVSLASVDARLNRIYRALITEMRRQEGVRPGGKDPASVARLRIAQRAWLVYRDSECRRRGKGKEGRLWAKSRARCLGEFSSRRANELADNFSRLTAH